LRIKKKEWKIVKKESLIKNRPRDWGILYFEWGLWKVKMGSVTWSTVYDQQPSLKKSEI
jgi:hypothetical protein